MSFRAERFKKYKTSGLVPKASLFDEKSVGEIREMYFEILNGGIHGLCFSLYEDGQKPGDTISEGQIRRRMKILQPYAKWIRSFSCTEGNELIPLIAKELGMKTLVGAWLGKDQEKNEEEIENLIQLAKDGFVDIAAVGNEVLYRKDLSEPDLLGYLRRVKTEIPGIPVGYVDAYYEFAKRPALADACDVILSNCYPFWEGTDFRYSLEHMQNMFKQAKVAGKGKKVIITETGWPADGGSLGNATPSKLYAIKYFISTQLWAAEEEIEVFYFSSFDESWKVGSEGDVGAYWGLWDRHEQLKYTDDNL